VSKALLVFMLFAIFGWSKTLRVAISANVSYAVEELAEEFSKTHSEIRVEMIVSSSGKLTAQIIHKAPFDIFLSADMQYPKKLYKMGLSSKPKLYARGTLALFSKKSREFSQGLNLLREPTIKKIAVANPKVAPYGRATLEALKKQGVYQNIKSKLIFGESVSQTLSYSLKVADVGVVAKSLLLSPKMSQFKRGSNWIEIDSSFYTPIEQGVVILNSKNREDAKLFLEFLSTKRAKEILKKYGYLIN
jgi:molybdate transport system substrate-binding protein